MKTKEAKDLAKKPVRKRVRKKPVAKKPFKTFDDQLEARRERKDIEKFIKEAKKVEVKEPLTSVEKVQVILIVSIIAALFYFGT
jgi:hypothetical protein